MRQRGIEREVGHFMRELWSERRSLTIPADSAGEWVHRHVLRFWARWQRVLNALLRGPVGRLARRFLSVVRGRRLRGGTGSDPNRALPTSTVQ
jgi:hypothetical protein